MGPNRGPKTARNCISDLSSHSFFGLRCWKALGDRFGTLLGPLLGPSWAHVGPHLGHLGPHLGHLEPHLGHLGPHLGHLGPHLGHLAPQLGISSLNLAPPAPSVRFFGPNIPLLCLEHSTLFCPPNIHQRT